MIRIAIGAMLGLSLGIAIQAALAAPKKSKVDVALPDCRATDETRTRVPVWTGRIKKESMPTRPPIKDGLVVYLQLYGDKEDVECPTDGTRTRIVLTAEKSPNGGNGTEVILDNAKTQFANGSCFITDFFMNEIAHGIHQGWISAYFRPVDKFEVIKSGQFCLDQK